MQKYRTNQGPIGNVLNIHRGNGFKTIENFKLTEKVSKLVHFPIAYSLLHECIRKRKNQCVHDSDPRCCWKQITQHPLFLNRLTAFVLKAIAQAWTHILIDEAHINQTLTWLSQKQKDNGCFGSSGSLLNNAIKVSCSDSLS